MNKSNGDLNTSFFHRIDWTEFGSIGSFGALGGIASMVYSVISGSQPTLSVTPWGVAGYMALGSVAAFLGVYLIAKTDTRQVKHALTFALACGISWSPIFDGASALVEKNKERATQAKADQLIEEAREYAVLLQQSSVEKIPQLAKEAGRVSGALADVVSQTHDIRLVRRASSALDDLIESGDRLEDRGVPPEIAQKARNKIAVGTVSIAAVEMLPATLGFKDLDSNKDGNISLQEAAREKELTERWGEIDKNADSKINAIEFCTMEVEAESTE